MDLFSREEILAAEQAGDQANLREVLDRLHLVVRGEEIGPDGQRPVVGQQHAVVRLDVLPHRFRQFARRGRGVLRNRDAPERGQHFGQYRAVQGDPCHGEPRRRRRMCMHDRPHVGPLPVDLEVHQHFGRRIPLTFELPPVQVGDAHHVGRHESLADAFGGHEQAVVAQPD